MSPLPPKADIDGHFLNVRVWPFTQVLHQSIVLSTTMRLPTVLLSLSEIIFLYSSDPYQASAAAREGNSMITKRGWGHSPSRTVRFPPRAMKFPPKEAIVLGTSLRYSSNIAWSLTVSTAITYAFIVNPLY